MPPKAAKRKATGIGKGKPAKRSKRREITPSLENKSDNEDRVFVQWALPPQGKTQPERNQSAAVTNYAQTLYGRPWDAIRTVQRPFRWPPIRTPLFKKLGKNLEQDTPNWSSVALRRFFNQIKRHTEENDDYPGRTYSRHAFNQAFVDAGDDVAVVASRSIGTPILVLDQDYRVQA